MCSRGAQILEPQARSRDRRRCAGNPKRVRLCAVPLPILSLSCTFLPLVPLVPIQLSCPCFSFFCSLSISLSLFPHICFFFFLLLFALIIVIIICYARLFVPPPAVSGARVSLSHFSSRFRMCRVFRILRRSPLDHSCMEFYIYMRATVTARCGRLSTVLRR